MQINKDPIQEIEHIVKEVHHEAKKYTEPVLSRYPLLFAFLIVFSVSAILDGFKIYIDTIPFFEEHPLVLMVLGVLLLLFTGKLYQALEKMK